VICRGRQRLYDGVIPRDDLKGAIRSLRRGRTLWYAADQDYGASHSVFAPFFGVPAATITMTTRLARVNDSPVVFFSHFREPNGRFLLKLSPPLEGYPSGDDVADAARMNLVIEAAIRSHPEQYFWLHRRFKTRPPGESSPYRVQPHRRRRARQRSAAS
jgi:KDO2-lipid IV(A) lauroyltransferase